MKKWKRIVSVMLVFCIVIGLVIVPNETKKVKAETKMIFLILNLLNHILLLFKKPAITLITGLLCAIM